MGSPLIMGNDLRRISNESLAVLLNKDMIAVSQDPLGQMGIRLPQFNSQSTKSIWAKNLANGDVAVALYNKGTDNTSCSGEWSVSEGGYWDACRPGENFPNAEPVPFTGLTLRQAQQECCWPDCEGFNYNAADGSGNFTTVQG